MPLMSERRAAFPSKPCEQPDHEGTKNRLEAQVRAEAWRHPSLLKSRLAKRSSLPEACFSRLPSGLRGRTARRCLINRQNEEH